MIFVVTILAILISALTGDGAKALTSRLNRVEFAITSKGQFMAIDVAGYLAEIQRLHASGQATEHTYRPALQKLFDSINEDVRSYNEPKGVKVGRPDFVFIREAGKNAQITVGHCEAKDIGLGINPKGMNDFNKAQHDRYVKALPNLVYTNGLEFRFYKKGELSREISIADFLMGIQPKVDQFDVLANLLKDFCAERLQTIESAERLAEMMAGKATLIKDILFNTLKEDADLQTELTGQYQSFKTMLIHDLTAEDFADIYAETIAYGMFGARLHDETRETFSRVEALELMPKSNPFLRKLFGYVAGPDLDERIRRTVDELAEIFQATDLKLLFEDFGKFTQRNDPFIHFYETFLAEYNPAKRKARGVWYTPEPVVNFIVRAVDDVLKSEFGLADGLADTSKVTIDWDTGETKNGKAVTVKKEVHRVQILDPAAGTGTFLAEVIKQIAPKVKDVAEGQWSSYVEKELIPRLHGFELLMASYAMCHMKLDMMLTKMGYKPTANPPRMGVYLTNSLEEGERADQSLPFDRWLSNEAKDANTIKRDMPIMCVIGNPPYSSSSSNKSTWIRNLTEVYKKDLDETSLNSLSDDYVKFLRLAEHLIEENGDGILAMITNNSYVDGVVHKTMRKHFLSTFDKVFILNLLGDSNKGDKCADGTADQNVFDIKQGVSVIIALKTGEKSKDEAQIRYNKIQGKRKPKTEQLWNLRVADRAFKVLRPEKPYYFFIDKDLTASTEYFKGFSLSSLFIETGSGIGFRKDELLVRRLFTRLDVVEMVKAVGSQTKEMLLSKYALKETSDWRLSEMRVFFKEPIERDVQKVTYRPLDIRFTYYPISSVQNFIPRGDSRRGLMRHMIEGENIALLLGRQNKSGRIDHYFVSDALSEMKTAEGTIKSYHFPLYLYPDEQDLDQTRRVNFDPKIHKAIIAAATGPSKPAKGRAPQGEGGGKVPDEVAIFDYIYGVLHCPAYRETYKEFLKIDFPRVPYPPSPEVFWDVSAKGSALRKLHLMEDAAIGPTPYKFTGVGDTVVGKVKYEGGRVAINDAQGFDNVPEIAWNFYIGGYQPAQKWLKDRKGRELSFEDIKHYQKIIKILSETDRIMKTIEMPL
jgi:type I restriction-modification system DNA methylase subunit